MPRCQVGDLCLIVSDPVFPENVGRCVTIVAPADVRLFWKPGVLAHLEAAPHDWECRPENEVWCCAEELPLLTRFNVAFGDAELLPIRKRRGLDLADAPLDLIPEMAA